MKFNITDEICPVFEENGMYHLQFYKTSLSCKELVDNYFDPKLTLAGCEDCYNYNKYWSCPNHDFDLLEYWNQYHSVDLYVVKITFDPSLMTESYSEDEMQMLFDEILPDVTGKLCSYAFTQEGKNPGSVSFTAGGACKKCKNGCAKTLGQPCRFPEKLRYSVESLGINATKAVEDLFAIPLVWPLYGKLPAYLTFVSGLLKVD